MNCGQGRGNVEAGVLLETTAARVRAMFWPPGLAVLQLTSGDLADLAFRPSAEAERWPLIPIPFDDVA
jgi:hypothetical protein